MSSLYKTRLKRLLAEEQGTISKPWHGKLSIALVYPNRYRLGMANLGFQGIYGLLNSFSDVVCERAFLPDPEDLISILRKNEELVTLESQHSLRNSRVMAFSIPFEEDYINVLRILERSGIPMRSRDRGDHHPIVIAGGVAVSLNPEPLAEFIDAFVIGEAEPVLNDVIGVLGVLKKKMTCRDGILNELSQLNGVYVSLLYESQHRGKGQKIKRQTYNITGSKPLTSVILTPNSEFANMRLVEVGRGCIWKCRFCATGFIYLPPRFWSADAIIGSLAGLKNGDKYGLISPMVTDYPDIERLCDWILERGRGISMSSLRIGRLSDKILHALKQGGQKTITIAPEAGTERLRRVMNKNISDEEILESADRIIEMGITNLKLYFMIGLPSETQEDVDGIITLAKSLHSNFIQKSRLLKRIGTLSLSIGSFVPKPWTPFQWKPFLQLEELERRMSHIKNSLKHLDNMTIKTESIRASLFQSIISRGDRNVGNLLLQVHQANGDLKKSASTIKKYMDRKREYDEPLPWDFIDAGIDKDFLIAEAKRSNKETLTGYCMPESCKMCGVC